MPRRKAQAREWRLALLARWVRFAFDVSAGAEALGRQLGRLIFDTVPSTAAPHTKDPEAIRWAQDQARKFLRAIAERQEWELPISELEAADPLSALYVVSGITGVSAYWQCNPKAGVLRAIEALALNPEVRRVQHCTEPGCPGLFVRIKGAGFCDAHRTAQSRSRRYRQRRRTLLTTEERRALRHRYYLNHLKKYNPARYRHLKKLESRGAANG